MAAGRNDIKAEDMPLTKTDYPAYPGMATVQEPGSFKDVDFPRCASPVLDDSSFTEQTDSYREVTAFERFERPGLTRQACHSILAN